MRSNKINIPYSNAKKICFVVCLLTSVIFAFAVSFHDYLPVHPPAYLLLAEDKLKHQYMASGVLKAKENVRGYGYLDIYATCDAAQAAPDGYASLICIAVTGNNQEYRGLIYLSSDLSPPAA